MSDEPRRWLGSDADAPDEVRELLRSAERPRAMSAAERSAGARAVAALGAKPVGLLARLASRPLLLGGGVLVGAVVLAVAASHRTHPSPDHTAPRSHPAVTAPVAPLVVDPPTIAPSPVAPAAPPTAPIATAHLPQTHAPATHAHAAPTSASPSTIAPEDQLDREHAALEAARDLTGSDPGRALTAIADYDARFPHGQLVPERDEIEIEALLHAGRTDEARARATRALAQGRGSAYRQRIERLLGAPVAP